MDRQLRDEIHDLVIGKDTRLEPWKRGARAILTAEVRSLLEGVYGLDRTGRLVSPDRLPVVQQDPEARETYERIARHLADERAAGLAATDAAEKLVREVAFTHLNRFVAFKMLEARNLIRETLRRGPDSNGFKFYLADHPEDEARWSAGDVDAAYRHFLLWQSGQIAREVRVLFDPDNLASRLFPRPPALKEVLKLLNDDAVAPAWAEEETIGWVYQYFNEREKADVFRRLYKEKQKIRREDIPAATQLFTPRWIVSFLVQNTLGRTWLQMHPDSRLAEKMDLLVPLAGEIPPVAAKPVKAITILDPACGAMHFGLVAFDLLVEMYREEIAHAGEPGWPAIPSVATEAEIPAAIIAHNLHGIDIDLRAVQLAALTLYIKAKTLNKTAALRESNLASADVLPFREQDLTAFLAEMRFTDPIYERVLRALWPRLRELSEVGSLARLEADIARVVAEERKRRAKAEREAPLLADQLTGSARQAADATAWWYVEEQIGGALNDYAKLAAEQGVDTTFFVGETTKGLQLLELMRRRYDVVLTNPPYLTNFTDTLRTVLARDYPTAKSDTYAAFIVRCIEWLRDGGRVGMITQQSFMFLQTYQKLREDLLSKMAIETMSHTGPRAFEEIVGQKVNTTLFALRLEPNQATRDSSDGFYIRVVEEVDKADATTNALQSGTNVYRLRQAELSLVPGTPLIYWLPENIRSIFGNFPKLGDAAPPRQGLATADNARFLRHWWEIGKTGIAFGCVSRDAALGSGKRWVPYMKGGRYRKWYGNQENVVNWAEDGRQIKEFYGPNGRPASRVQNQDFYFREGMSWSKVTSGGFAIRWSPPGFLFDVAGCSIFPKQSELYALMGVLNSSFVADLLRATSPTINYEVGQIAAIPLPPSALHDESISQLARQACRAAMLASSENETTFDFTAPSAWSSELLQPEQMQDSIPAIQAELDRVVSDHYGVSLDESLRLAIATTDDPEEEQEMAAATEDEQAEAAETPSLAELATRWLSYAVGIILGRFEPGLRHSLGSAIVEHEFEQTCHQFSLDVEGQLRELADADGIAPLEAGHSDDLAMKVGRALDLMLGEHGAQGVIEKGARGELRNFLEQEYWQRHHLKWYRKRPPYWLLQSPKKLYSVYVFHERVTSDTLFVLEQRYVAPKIAATRNAIAELTARVAAVIGKEKRALEKEIEAKEALLTDLLEFERRIEAITAAGYDPHIDDGILIRLAPLHPLLPSFSKEPREAWAKLAKGDFDWSHMAMQHWPERVQTKCRTDKSLAIAHDRLDLYAGGH